MSLRGGGHLDEDWITVNGTHIPLDDDGNAIGGGKLKGKNFSRAKSEKKPKKASASGLRGTPPTKTQSETVESINKLKDAPRMKPKGQFKKTVFPLAGANAGPDEQLEMYKISIDPIDMSVGKEEVVDLGTLKTVQTWTDSRKLNGIAKSIQDVDDMTPSGQTDGLPIVIKYKGEYILRDGNHRATVAKLSGKTSIRANVLDWEEATKNNGDSEDTDM